MIYYLLNKQQNRINRGLKEQDFSSSNLKYIALQIYVKRYTLNLVQAKHNVTVLQFIVTVSDNNFLM